SGAPLFWRRVLPSLETVDPDPVPLPTTPLRTPRSLLSTSRSGRALGCRPERSRRTSLPLERSSSNKRSIFEAKPGSSATRSISQLATRLLKLRFVEPTFDHQPSATMVLAWIIGPPYSKIRQPASRNCRWPAGGAL